MSAKKQLQGLTNPHIIVLAAFLLGGDSGYVETEDVAVEADKLAPGRFRWKKHPENIDLERVRYGCEDAKKPQLGLLMGSPKKGWMLTEAGLSFAKSAHKKIDNMNLEKKPLSERERRIISREKTRLRSTEAYEKYINDDADSITKRDAEAFFRLDDYITGDAREKKITRTCNMFTDDQELGELTSMLANMIRGE